MTTTNKPDESITLAEFLNQGIGVLLFTRPLTAQSMAIFVTTLRDHVLPTLGTSPVEEVPAQLPSLITELLGKGLPPKAVYSALRILKRVMAVVPPENMIISPVDIPPRSGVCESFDYLDRDSIEQLLAMAPDDIEHFMFRLMTDTGMRAGEVVALRWNDFDFVRGAVTVTSRRLAFDPFLRNVTLSEGNQSRVVPLGTRLAELAATCFADAMDARVFASADIAEIGRRFRRILDRVRSQFTNAHTIRLSALRQTFGMRLRQRGVPLDLISKWLGISRHIAIELGFADHDASRETVVRTFDEERTILNAALEASGAPDEQK